MKEQPQRAPNANFAPGTKNEGLSPKGALLLWRVERTVQSLAVAAAVMLLVALLGFRAAYDAMILRAAVFVGVATAPQWFIDRIAQIAETLSPDLPAKISKRSFRNLGAFVGVIERPLYLGSLVAGYPEFIAVWFVFKGIAGYRLGLKKKQRKERRLFQLFLLNNALSLAGAGLGWLAWNLLDLSWSPAPQ